MATAATAVSFLGDHTIRALAKGNADIAWLELRFERVHQEAQLFSSELHVFVPSFALARAYADAINGVNERAAAEQPAPQAAE